MKGITVGRLIRARCGLNRAMTDNSTSRDTGKARAANASSTITTPITVVTATGGTNTDRLDAVGQSGGISGPPARRSAHRFGDVLRRDEERRNPGPTTYGGVPV